MKATEGPWTVDCERWAVVDREGRRLASASVNNGSCSRQLAGLERELNLRRMAAAPELIKMLRCWEMVYAEWAAVALPAAVGTESFKLVSDIVGESRALLNRLDDA